jgi:sugar phosphate isomerase/epimerase
MFVPTLTGPANPTMDDVKKVASEFNKMGEQAAKAGVVLGLHNEDFELTTVDGKRTYDVLLDLLDPKVTTLQFQVSTISRGYDAAEYFTKYPGRFISMHAQDWSAAAQKTVALGQGDLDWKKIFSAAQVGGLKNYFVELNLEAMRASVTYLRQLTKAIQ